MAEIAQFIEWLVDFGANKTATVLVLVYAPYQSILAIRSTGVDDDKQWLTFWTIFFLIEFAEKCLAFFSNIVPFWDSLKLGLLIFLMFFGGANKIYNALEPFLVKYEDILESKINEVCKNSNIRKLLKSDPVTFLKKCTEEGGEKKMIDECGGQEAFDKTKALALEIAKTASQVKPAAVAPVKVDPPKTVTSTASTSAATTTTDATTTDATASPKEIVPSPALTSPEKVSADIKTAEAASETKSAVSQSGATSTATTTPPVSNQVAPAATTQAGKPPSTNTPTVTAATTQAGKPATTTPVVNNTQASTAQQKK